MASNAFEQSQTNLVHRLGDRIDVVKLATSSTLSEVDCGKFLYVLLDDDMTITLPPASQCIGGEIKGMVTHAGDGQNTITIRDDTSLVLDSQPVAGRYEDVQVGFSFSATSTGKSWCLVTAGVLASLEVGPQPNITGLGTQTQDLNMGAKRITNVERIGNVGTVSNSENLSLSVGSGNRGLTLKRIGDHTFEGNLVINGTLATAVGPQPHITGLGTQAQNLSMGGKSITDVDTVLNSEFLNLKVGSEFSGNRGLVLKRIGDHTLDGNLTQTGTLETVALHCQFITTSNNPRITVQKTTAGQGLLGGENVKVTWPDSSGRGSFLNRAITVNDQKDQFTIPLTGWYSVSWTISWPDVTGISGKVKTWVGINDTPQKFGFQSTDLLGLGSGGTLQSSSCIVHVTAGEFISVFVRHGNGTTIDSALIIPADLNGDDVMQLYIVRLP